jgi:hypothetical protein
LTGGVVANATLSAFSYSWIVVGDEEIYIDATAAPVSKLTPQMLQRFVQPLMQVGYFGKQPFKDMPPMIEIVTDLETCWELDRLGGQTPYSGSSGPTTLGNWRFETWEGDQVNKYWKYGFSGQVGNFAVRVDPFQLRFNLVGNSPTTPGSTRFQVVLPFVNVPSSGAGGSSGIKAIPNLSFQLAQYAWSFLYHRKGLQVLVSDATPINPEMPFSARDFGGRWQFVRNNLGADVNGQPIENKRGNKGQFIADFKQAVRPQYTELLQLIFHMREPACLISVVPCNASPGYPTQNYESDPVDCTGNPIVD